MSDLQEDLLEGNIIKTLYEEVSRSVVISTEENLEYFLGFIASYYPFEVSDALSYFAELENPEDPSDVIDSSNISWDMFRTRMANFLASVKVSAQSQYSEEEILSFLFESVPSLLDIMRPQYTRHRSEVINKSQEQTAGRSAGSKRDLKEEQGSWITSYIDQYLDDISQIFNSLNPTPQGMIDAMLVKNLLREILLLINMPLSKGDLFLFDRMIENRYKVTRNGTTVYMKISFYKCLDLIEEWAKKDTLNKLRFHRMLDQTIKQFEQLQIQHNTYEDLHSFVQSLYQFKATFNHQTRRTHKATLKEQQLKGVKKIFTFYARQMQMTGRAPTFDHLTQNNQIWNMGKFFKFCSDFGIMGKQRESRKLSKDQLGQVFKSTAHNSIHMDLKQFYSALDMIAELFFNHEYERLNGQEVAAETLETKRQLLYSFMNADDPEKHSAKMQGFGLPFSKEKAGFRIFEDDISKRYKFNDPRRVHKVTENKKPPPKPEMSPKPFAIQKKPQVKALKAGYLKNLDSFTWGQLNSMRHNDFIKNEELLSIFTPEDVKELQVRSKA